MYGTPIPFWYCEDCGGIIPPDGEKLLKGVPVDPAVESAPVDKCPKCGSTNINGSTDVCDCWVDSSITPLVITKWKRNEEFFKKTYPVTLRPQGYDIIRTWAFYTIFRALILAGKAPFKDIVINGMVAGPDGKKMDKSHGNIVPPEEVLEKYGADCLRQWALSASLGEDYPLDWKKLIYASKFLQKYFNSAFLLHKTFSTLSKEEKSLDYKDIKIMDEWILGRLNEVKKEVTDLLDKYEFAKALEILRSFWWSEVCDYYLEMIKPRVYAGDKVVGKVCYKLLDEFNRLMAPFIPHITEEIYHEFLNHSETESVHLEEWPEYEAESPKVEEEVTKTVLNFVSAIRTYKSKNSLSLKEEISKVIFHGPTTDKLREFIRETLLSLFVKDISFEEEGAGEILLDNNSITIKS